MSLTDFLLIIKLMFFYGIAIAVFALIGGLALIIMAIVSTGQPLH